MSLLVYKMSDYENTAENEQFRAACKSLKKYFARRDDLYLFIANYCIFDCELDALLIKPDAIIIVEFKNYSGNITAVNNGKWKCNIDTIIKGGSHKNPYVQAMLNRSKCRQGLIAGGFFKQSEVEHIASLIVFKEIKHLDNKLDGKSQSWCHICDSKTFIEKAQDITDSAVDISKEQMLALTEKLNLQRECLIEEYSNMEILTGEEPPKPTFIEILQQSYHDLCVIGQNVQESAKSTITQKVNEDILPKIDEAKLRLKNLPHTRPTINIKDVNKIYDSAKEYTVKRRTDILPGKDKQD